MSETKSTLERVQIFHETYGLPVATEPTLADEKTQNLRVNLLAEEVQELKEALENNDLVEVLDALTDIQYVLDGAYLSFGLQDMKEIAFAEVQRSNMSKLGEDGKPIRRESDGKVMKGPNYSAPDLKSLLDKHIKEKLEKAA